MTKSANFRFSVERHLPAEARAHVDLRRALAAHGALDLLRFLAGHQNQSIEPLVAAGFDQDGGLDYRNPIRFAPGIFGDQLLLALRPPPDAPGR